MPVSDFIAHQIDRSQTDEPATAHCRDSVIPVDDVSSQLVNEVKQAFSAKTSKRYGQFDPEMSDNPLRGWLRDYLKNSLPFLSLSQQIAKHFSTLLSDVEVAFQGHILIWQETTADAQWLFIAQVQHETGLVINSNLDVSETVYADLSHIGFCCRINLSHWKDELSEKYLTVSKNRGDRYLQDVFIRWIGFTDTVNITQDTNEFLNIVEAYATQLPEDQSKQYKEKVVEYCMDQDKQGEPVVYKELSYYLDEHEPARFESFVQEQQENDKPEFIPDKTQLRKYTRFSGRSKEVSVQFSAALLGHDVEFDAQNERLIIHKLPKALLSQLKKHRT